MKNFILGIVFALTLTGGQVYATNEKSTLISCESALDIALSNIRDLEYIIQHIGKGE